MSFDALAWAAKQKPGNLAAKMALLALANYAGETGLAYPSTAAIADFGDMNHKTATAALDRLESLGLISDSGKRAGKSGQIKVYQLNLGSLPKTEASQKRKPPVFSEQGTQKRVTDTVREPVSSEAEASSDKRVREPKFDFPCPDGVDPIDWSALIANRKAKRAALSEGAHRQITRKLDGWARSGWPPGPIVAHAAERGWTTVFETDEMKNGQLGRHERIAPVRQDGRKPGSIEQAGREAMAILAAQRNRGPGGQARPALDGGGHRRVVALPAPDGAGGDDAGGPPRMAFGGGARG